jgi:hypothetical protein
MLMMADALAIERWAGRITRGQCTARRKHGFARAGRPRQSLGVRDLHPAIARPSLLKGRVTNAVRAA